jgi:mannonate dehydratase
MSTDAEDATAARSAEELPMRVGVRSSDLSDEQLSYLAQLGVENVFVNPVGEPDPDGLLLRPDAVPDVGTLIQTRNRLEDAGLRMAGIQSLSGYMYDDIMFGREGAQQQTEAIKRLLRNMGRANIPALGYQWNPRSVPGMFMTTSRSARVRGGAKAREFDLADVDDPAKSSDPSAPDYDEAAFWERFEAFLEEVIPVAEEAGVPMALHPADPPNIERLEGVPRLMRDPAAFERAMDAVDSEYNGIKLCLGCFSEMGEDVPETIERFGDRTVFVHFRDVIGTMPAFRETFVDDPEGNFDALEAVRALDDVGFSGVLIPDHVPHVEGDTDWGHRARGYTTGYLKGLVRAIGDGA